jgi:hypothetical protein
MMVAMALLTANCSIKTPARQLHHNLLMVQAKAAL